jgi:hypothetical protein
MPPAPSAVGVPGWPTGLLRRSATRMATTCTSAVATSTRVAAALPSSGGLSAASPSSLQFTTCVESVVNKNPITGYWLNPGLVVEFLSAVSYQRHRSKIRLINSYYIIYNPQLGEAAGAVRRPKFFRKIQTEYSTELQSVFNQKSHHQLL